MDPQALFEQFSTPLMLLTKAFHASNISYPASFISTNTKALRGSLRLLRPIFRSTRRSISNTSLNASQSSFRNLSLIEHSFSKTYQIHSPSDQMISHTRTILTPATSHQYHGMLLHIVSLARNITRHYSPCAQPHSGGFPFCGIGFLGLRDTDFEADTF